MLSEAKNSKNDPRHATLPQWRRSTDVKDCRSSAQSDVCIVLCNDSVIYHRVMTSRARPINNNDVFALGLLKLKYRMLHNDASIMVTCKAIVDTTGMIRGTFTRRLFMREIHLHCRDLRTENLPNITTGTVGGRSSGSVKGRRDVQRSSNVSWTIYPIF